MQFNEDFLSTKNIFSQHFVVSSVSLSISSTEGFFLALDS